ncbi:hypothetical protein ACFU7Y_40895 [Kitasatospora sp. NPDC057542]|uniref:hypothetical protein n=1 Tax=Kitasatospora sp. NPDC057542 TaxID=3346162 RepID=UPI003674E8C4
MTDLSKPIAARPVFDPAVPVETQDAVRDLAALQPALLAADRDAGALLVSYMGGSALLRRGLAAAALGGAAALAPWAYGS